MPSEFQKAQQDLKTAEGQVQGAVNDAEADDSKAVGWIASHPNWTLLVVAVVIIVAAVVSLHSCAHR